MGRGGKNYKAATSSSGRDEVDMRCETKERKEESRRGVRDSEEEEGGETHD